MKYLEASFSTFAVGSDSYRENHDRIFGKKDTAVEGDTGTTETVTDPEGATLPSVPADAIVSQCLDALEEAEPCLEDLVRRYSVKRYHRALASVRAALASARAMGFR